MIQATSYAELQTLVDRMLAKGRQYPGMVNLDTDLRLNKPQLSVVLKRDKIAAVGADVEKSAGPWKPCWAGDKSPASSGRASSTT